MGDVSIGWRSWVVNLQVLQIAGQIPENESGVLQ
jgi:hypothetical protein